MVKRPDSDLDYCMCAVYLGSFSHQDSWPGSEGPQQHENFTMLSSHLSLRTPVGCMLPMLLSPTRSVFPFEHTDAIVKGLSRGCDFEGLDAVIRFGYEVPYIHHIEPWVAEEVTLLLSGVVAACQGSGLLTE